LAKGFVCLRCGGPRYNPWKFFHENGKPRS
jgi:hypothetical protein